MKNTLLFGSSDLFAIEISEKSKVAALRIWINGKSYGSFKRKDRLIDSIIDVYTLLENIDNLHEKSIDQMDANSVFFFAIFRSNIRGIQ